MNSLGSVNRLNELNLFILWHIVNMAKKTLKIRYIKDNARYLHT